jgi:23S rRNA pseudouridine1911/1915/1917 synthase
MSISQTWTVDSEAIGQRLDQFVLANAVSAVSRTRIQALIQKEQILVNEKPATKHQFLKLGDVVTVVDATMLVPATLSTVLDWKKIPAVDIPVLFEDDAIIVVNKPSSVVVHPNLPGDVQPSVASWFVAHCGAAVLEETWEHMLRPGIVHRLDKPVTGVMVLAKTGAVFQQLKKQFQLRTVEKSYRAIVYGVPSQEAGDIRFVLHRSTMNPGKMAARPEHAEGREAWTEYVVLRSIHDRYAELSVRIHTGRTHQIRAHLAAIDHPVVGDRMYASKKYPVYPKSDALFLHSERLAFDHPVSGERMTFEAPFPEHFSLFD